MISILKYLKNQKGIGGVGILIFMLVFGISMSMLMEWYRDGELKETMQIHLEKGLNIAVEASMIDEYRQEHISKIDTARAMEEFEDYLHKELKMDDNYIYKDDYFTYQLVLDDIDLQSDPPIFKIRGRLITDPVLLGKDLIPGVKIEIPLKASARNQRIEE